MILDQVVPTYPFMLSQQHGYETKTEQNIILPKNKIFVNFVYLPTYLQKWK